MLQGRATMALPLLARSVGGGSGAALRLLRPAPTTLRLARVPFRCMAAKGGKGKGKEKEEGERGWAARRRATACALQGGPSCSPCSRASLHLQGLLNGL